MGKPYFFLLIAVLAAKGCQRSMPGCALADSVLPLLHATCDIDASVLWSGNGSIGKLLFATENDCIFPSAEDIAVCLAGRRIHVLGYVVPNRTQCCFSWHGRSSPTSCLVLVVTRPCECSSSTLSLPGLSASRKSLAPRAGKGVTFMHCVPMPAPGDSSCARRCTRRLGPRSTA